ncbi:MAG TPA: ATP-binding protein, partial [Holophagaceae bacterium]
RKQMESAELLDLNALVREQADVLERTTLKKAEWVLDLDPGLPPILGQASDLGNALINLCINALDAMSRGGRITLRTRCDPGGCAVLSVEDNGAGMTPEVLARALDPFFTTKPAGKGTGLGLPMVYGTMKAHGGSLELQSEPGAGTRVHLRFPPAGGTAAPASLGGSATSDLPPARVLLVDDDELVRLTVPPLLEALGLEAESVESGLQALDRLEAAPRIDLVILDQNMPQLSGAESLARIRSRWPELPVLLASGYREAEPAAYDRLATLEKPYTLDALRRALARLLGSVQPELPPRT